MGYCLSMVLPCLACTLLSLHLASHGPGIVTSTSPYIFDKFCTHNSIQHTYLLIAAVLMGVEDEDAGQEVKLTPADVKKYESQFSGSVFHYDSLEMKEAIGEG